MITFPRCIVDFENQNQWDRAIDYLLEDWHSYKNDLNKMLCAATEIWFVLVYYEQLEFADHIKENNLQKKLDEVSDYAFQNFSSELLFKLFFGYMMSLFPYLFSVPGKGEYEDAYDYNEQLGRDMLRQAFQLEPDNAAAKIFSDGSDNDDYGTHLQLKRENRDAVNALFPEDGCAVTDYFRGMLT